MQFLMNKSRRAERIFLLTTNVLLLYKSFTTIMFRESDGVKVNPLTLHRSLLCPCFDASPVDEDEDSRMCRYHVPSSQDLQGQTSPHLYICTRPVQKHPSSYLSPALRRPDAAEPGLNARTCSQKQRSSSSSSSEDLSRLIQS